MNSMNPVGKDPHLQPVPPAPKLEASAWAVREDKGIKYLSRTIKATGADGKEKEYTVTASYKAADLEAHFEPDQIEATIKKIVDKIAADHQTIFPSLAGSKVSFNPQNKHDVTVLSHPNSNFSGKKIEQLKGLDPDDKGKGELDDDSPGKDPEIYTHLLLVSDLVHQCFEDIAKRKFALNVQDTTQKKVPDKKPEDKIEFDRVTETPDAPQTIKNDNNTSVATSNAVNPPTAEETSITVSEEGN